MQNSQTLFHPLVIFLSKRIYLQNIADICKYLFHLRRVKLTEVLLITPERELSAPVDEQLSNHNVIFHSETHNLHFLQRAKYSKFRVYANALRWPVLFYRRAIVFRETE